MLNNLDEISGISAVRQRIGSASGKDRENDDIISAMSPLQFTRAYCGWHLGDESWADIIIGVYESAKDHTEGEMK